MRIAIILFASFIPVYSIAQSVMVQPDRFLADQRGGISPSPSFAIDKKDTSLFGSGKQPEFILPQVTGSNAFTFAPCPYLPEGYMNDGRTLIYFTRIGLPDMRAFVDRNFNYNYTDDGEGYAVDSTGAIQINFVSPTNPNNIIRMRYTLLSTWMDVSKIPMVIFSGNSYYAGTILSDRELWFSAEQQWIQGKDVVIDNDSMCIVFYDRNIDGCFTGSEDMIAICPYGADSAHTTKYHGARDIESGLVLGYNEHAYEITYDTNVCNTITIKRRPELNAPLNLIVGDQLPHFSIQLVAGDSSDIYTLMEAGKYTYIEFWGIWCTGCRLIIPDIQNLNDTLGDRVKIISLDAYDDRNRVPSFVKEKGMTWTQGYSNNKAQNILYAGDVFPYGVLIDPQGKIVAFDVDPSDVAQIVR